MMVVVGRIFRGSRRLQDIRKLQTLFLKVHTILPRGRSEDPVKTSKVSVAQLGHWPGPSYRASIDDTRTSDCTGGLRKKCEVVISVARSGEATHLPEEPREELHMSKCWPRPGIRVIHGIFVIQMQKYRNNKHA